MSEPVESRIARIESHVEHIDAVTTDLRVELRRTNDRIDAGYKELSEKIEGGDKELGSTCKELNKKIDDVHRELVDKIDGVHHSLKDKLHSMALWALLLYVTLAAGLLTVIARSFKWI